MKKLLMIIVVIALAAIVVSPVGARMGGGGGYPGGGGYYDLAAVPGLNLTAEQTAQIRNLREAHLKDIQPLQNKLYSKRGELKLLWLQQSPDQGKITAADREIRALRDQIQDRRTSHRLATFKILTPEQQTKLQAYGAGRGYGSGKGMRDQGGMGMGPGMGRGADMRGY
jgi:Spy/CpxP family protein refolding chaperone